MLSEHNLIESVENILYPAAINIQAECKKLYDKQKPESRGPMGFIGDNELSYTIALLRASANMLERMAKEKNIKIWKI